MTLFEVRVQYIQFCNAVLHIVFVTIAVLYFMKVNGAAVMDV
jgi:hypothetical protein